MLLPYASDRPPRSRPIVVVSLVLANFLLFGIMAVGLARRSDLPVVWFASLSLVPASIRWYAPLTYSFLHEDVFHLSSNMLFLWVFGSSVEDALRWKRFLGVYAISAIVTGLLQALMARVIGGGAQLIPIVGASGAISALVGIFAVRFYRSRIGFVGLPFRVPAVLLIAGATLGEMGVSLYQLTHRSSAIGGQAAAHWAHVGGFILGVCWAQVSRQMQAGRREYLEHDAAEEMEHGSPLAAARRWEEVLRAEPNNLHAAAELAHAWALAGDREQSEPRYRTAIAGMLRSGNKAGAGARYVEMREFFPDAALDTLSLFAVARALEESGRTEDALACLEELVRRDPGAREAEIGRLRAGTLLLRSLGRPQEAAERLRGFLELYPESSWRPYAEELLREADRRGER